MARPHFKIKPILNILHGHRTIKVEMILAVTILFTPLVGVYADYKSWCGNGSETEIDLIKSEDGVPGRYIAQWCSHGDRNITQWNLELRYLKDNRSPENCIEYDVYNVHPHADLHSRVEEAINLNFSCPIVCLAKPLDLLFSSCYTLKSRVKFNNLWQHNDTMHYIHNNLTLAHYKNSTTYVHKISNDEELVLVWHSGYIPITEYSVQLYMFNESLPEGERSEDITAECECMSWQRVRCARRAAAGRYLCSLQHGAAWTHAAWLPSLYRWNFEHLTGAAPAPTAAASGVGTATLLAAAALAACAVAALAAVAHSARRRRKRVLHGWQAQRLQLESEMKLGAEEDIELLVLYAREARAQAAARALMELLRGAGAQVVDVHGAAAAARWAAAPAQRTRAALAAPHTRILLLLSPALRLAKEDEDSVPAGAAPQFGDVLLQYALRMIAEAPPTGNPYKTLFVLTLPGATETEVQDAHTLAHLVPFARYPLPRAATALLRQLHLKATDTTLQSFARSLAALPPDTKLATNGAC